MEKLFEITEEEEIPLHVASLNLMQQTIQDYMSKLSVGLVTEEEVNNLKKEVRKELDRRLEDIYRVRELTT